jgi:hypothetical protein
LLSADGYQLSVFRSIEVPLKGSFNFKKHMSFDQPNASPNRIL